MKKEEILKYLCYYDLRNPIGVREDISLEEIQEEGYGEYSKKDCYCSSCHYYRSKLAEELLKYVKNENT